MMLNRRQMAQQGRRALGKIVNPEDIRSRWVATGQRERADGAPPGRKDCSCSSFPVTSAATDFDSLRPTKQQRNIARWPFSTPLVLETTRESPPSRQQ
jgi:hypothetical protein